MWKSYLEPLITLLVFVVQKLWPKNNKQINPQGNDLILKFWTKLQAILE